MIRSVLLIVGLAAGLSLYGFLDFVRDVEALRDPGLLLQLEPTDAIVALTGGSERVTTGVELLESGVGKKLFISGVHKKLKIDGVLGSLPVAADLRACCIVLGYQADSTEGNAEETKQWMVAEHYTSLRLVTANYHMPRSLLLFRAAMPDARIIPHPVAPDSVKLDQWWQHPPTIELLATEYGKYVVATIKLWMKA